MNLQLTQTIVPLNREERFQKVQELSELFTSGRYNPLDLHLLFKSWIDTIEATLKNSDVKKAIEIELDKMPKTFDHLNCKVTKATKKTYDYSTCNDSIYNSLIEQMETIKLEIKSRESFLKALPDNGAVEESTGELINKPSFVENEYLRITF